MYKTDITPTRWIVYDIFGNIGWIAYYVVLVKCFAEKPEFMQYWGLAAVAVLAIIPALLMLVGLVELISERIQKLDYILPKARVYRGFGALSLGGITGGGRCAYRHRVRADSGRGRGHLLSVHHARGRRAVRGVRGAVLQEIQENARSLRAGIQDNLELKRSLYI